MLLMVHGCACCAGDGDCAGLPGAVPAPGRVLPGRAPAPRHRLPGGLCNLTCPHLPPFCPRMRCFAFPLPCAPPGSAALRQWSKTVYAARQGHEARTASRIEQGGTGAASKRQEAWGSDGRVGVRMHVLQGSTSALWVPKSFWDAEPPTPAARHRLHVQRDSAPPGPSLPS